MLRRRNKKTSGTEVKQSKEGKPFVKTYDTPIAHSTNLKAVCF